MWVLTYWFLPIMTFQQHRTVWTSRWCHIKRTVLLFLNLTSLQKSINCCYLCVVPQCSPVGCLQHPPTPTPTHTLCATVSQCVASSPGLNHLISHDSFFFFFCDKPCRCMASFNWMTFCVITGFVSTGEIAGIQEYPSLPCETQQRWASLWCSEAQNALSLL